MPARRHFSVGQRGTLECDGLPSLLRLTRRVPGFRHRASRSIAKAAASRRTPKCRRSAQQTSPPRGEPQEWRFRPESRSRAGGAILAGKHTRIRGFQILLTWVFRGKHYWTQFPALCASGRKAPASESAAAQASTDGGAVALHKMAGDRYAVAGDEEHLPKST
jgi:hypothetical protein